MRHYLSSARFAEPGRVAFVVRFFTDTQHPVSLLSALVALQSCPRRVADYVSHVFCGARFKIQLLQPLVGFPLVLAMPIEWRVLSPPSVADLEDAVSLSYGFHS